MAFDQDGIRLAVARSSSDIELWNVRDGWRQEMVRSLSLPNNSMDCRVTLFLVPRELLARNLRMSAAWYGVIKVVYLGFSVGD
jgi:hypothetical protein